MVESLNHEGRGVARVDGKVVFLDGALAGEQVLFRYRRRRGRFDEGQVVEVIVPAPERTKPRCPHFDLCGGCSLQHMDPSAQIRFKEARLLESLAHQAGSRPRTILPPLGAEVWGYRRKARIGAKYVARKDKVLVGFREKGSAFLADLGRCEVLHPSVGQKLDALGACIGALHSRREIPQVEVAVGDEWTALVFRHLKPLPALDREILAGFAREHGFRVLLQSGGPDTLEALWPQGGTELSYRLPAHDAVFRFRPTEFTQVNAGINVQMVDRALELLALRPDDRVLDLFCGLGNFTLPLARRVARVVGVEGESALVQRARDNAVLNGIHNAEFHLADLSRSEPDSDWVLAAWDKLLLDPPRSGAQAIVQGLRPPYPSRIVYVSCNPATLARDAGELVRRHGYIVDSAGVMDMFPHTSHVESIALFTR